MIEKIDDGWPARLRETEAGMTPRQLEFAMLVVRAAGWSIGDNIPCYVWQSAFNRAVNEVTEP